MQHVCKSCILHHSMSSFKIKSGFAGPSRPSSTDGSQTHKLRKVSLLRLVNPAEALRLTSQVETERLCSAISPFKQLRSRIAVDPHCQAHKLTHEKPVGIEKFLHKARSSIPCGSCAMMELSKQSSLVRTQQAETPCGCQFSTAPSTISRFFREVTEEQGCMAVKQAPAVSVRPADFGGSSSAMKSPYSRLSPFKLVKDCRGFRSSGVPDVEASMQHSKPANLDN